jgi:EAL domain-containing protein (putative c-di-GMP-specific phosphodiesterase class I)
MRLIAEAVETASELAMLRAFEMDRVQGYFVGCPLPLRDAIF